MSTPTSAVWQLDPMHSHVQFKVKHLVISTVTGEFKEATATLEGGRGEGAAQFEKAKITFEAKVASIHTGVEPRDAHLRSGDFFDAEHHPVIRFESTKFTHVGGMDYQLQGTLSIRGTTLPITLEATLGGVATDGYGQTKVGFELTGKLSRAAYGLTWNSVTEAGAVVVADEIKLIADVQLIKQ